MSCILRRGLATTLIALGFALAAAGGAWAGGTGLDEQDDEEAGTPFFGFAKDLDARGRGIPDTKVTAELKGGNASLVEANGFGLLIDIGLGPRQLAGRLAAIGLSWHAVHAVLLTHTHTDHWKDRTLRHLHRRPGRPG